MTINCIGQDPIIKFFADRVSETVLGAHTLDEYAAELGNSLDDNASVNIFQYGVMAEQEGTLVEFIAKLSHVTCIAVIAPQTIFERLNKRVIDYQTKRNLPGAPFYVLSRENAIGDLQKAVEAWQDWHRENAGEENKVNKDNADDLETWSSFGNFDNVDKHEDETNVNGIVLCQTSAKGGSGKCLAGDSLIVDADTGQTLTIEQAVTEKTLKRTLSLVDGKVVPMEVGDFHYNGEKEVYKLTFESGRYIEVTENHPMLTALGWKPAIELQVGETLASVTTTPCPESSGFEDLNLAFLTGLVCLKGRETKRGMFVTIADKGLESELRGIVPGVRKIEMYETDHSYRATFDIPESVFTQELLAVCSNPREERDIPPSVYLMPENSLVRFLQVVWKQFGQVLPTTPVPLMVFPSEHFARGIQSLLNRLGIMSTVHMKRTTNKVRTYISWRVSVIGASINRFGEVIDPLDCFLEYTPQTNRFTPNAKGISEKAAKLNGRLHYEKFRKEESSELVQRYEWVMSPHLFWDSLMSIEKVGVKKVYDLEIPQTHCFLANGLVVHNSSTAILTASLIAKSTALAARQGISSKPANVAIVDMDVFDGQLGFIVGKSAPTVTNLLAESSREEMFSNSNVKKFAVHDENLGIDLFLAPRLPTSAHSVQPEFYSNLIKTLRRVYDVVILDTSVNYLVDERLSRVAYPESDAIIYVTTLPRHSVMDMARWVDLTTKPVSEGGLGIDPKKIGILVNHSHSQSGISKTALLKAVGNEDITFLGHLPDIPAAIADKCLNLQRLDLLLEETEFNFGPAMFNIVSTLVGKKLPLAPIVSPSQNAKKRGATPQPVVMPQPQEPVQQPKKKKKFFGLF